jgi:uncharacterized protein (DUF1778 family)
MKKKASLKSKTVKRGRGRPKSEEPLPKVRQIGRIHQERWELWRNAAKLSEMAWTDWSAKSLDEAAKQVLRKHGLIK